MRRHHLIPKFYLLRFANPKSQVVAFRHSQAKSFTTSVENAAVESGFYSVWDETGTPSEMVEEALAQVEGINANVLRRIDADPLPPSDDDRASLAMLMALQMTRSRDWRHNDEAIADFLLRMQLYFQFNKATPEHRLDQVREIIGREVTQEDIDDLIDYSEGRGNIDFTPPINATIHSMLTTSLELFPYLYSRTWVFAKAEKRAFITSDNPVVLWRRPTEANRRHGVGVKNADEILFPLDPKKALILLPGPPGTVMECKVDSELVKRINTIVAHASHEWIFHHPRHEPLKGVRVPIRPVTPSMSVNNIPLTSGKTAWKSFLRGVR